MRQDLQRIVDSMFAFTHHLGLFDSLWGIDYHRTLEYALAVDAKPVNAKSFVDLGSGKHSVFPHFVAANYSIAVQGIDIRELAIQRQKKRAAHFHGYHKPIAFSVAAMENLPLEGDSCDYVTAISAVEHIENETPALEEIRRVLRPGRIAFLTLPYSPGGHQDIHRDKPSYTDDGKTEHHFFEHQYDATTLLQRIIDPSGLKVVKHEYIGEPGWSYRDFFLHIPGRNSLKYAFGWLHQPIAKRFLDIVQNPSQAQVVALTLRKT